MKYTAELKRLSATRYFKQNHSGAPNDLLLPCLASTKFSEFEGVVASEYHELHSILMTD